MFQYFLNLSRPRKRAFSVAVDVTALVLSLWASFALRLENPFWRPDESQLLVFVPTIIITIFAFIRLGLYRAIVRYMSDRALLTIFYGVGISVLTLVLSGFWLEAFVPRSVPLIYGVLAFTFVSGTRMWMRDLLSRPRGTQRERVAIVGTGKTGMSLFSALGQQEQFEPVLFLTDDRSKLKALINDVPVVGAADLVSAVRQYQVDRVLLALEPDSRVDRKRLISELEQLSVPVQKTPLIQDIASGRARISDVQELDLNDLLGRDPVMPDSAQVTSSLHQKSVLVTGAGGSIGSELCRQILSHRPARLVVFDQSEYALYAIGRELEAVNAAEGLDVELHVVLGSVMHRRRCMTIMNTFNTDIVFHAAAYKHVPLVEQNLIEGVQNNTFGTLHVAEAAIEAGVERFILISTDKAVRPTNIMGASKRLAELVLQGLAERQTGTRFSMVRFGNVLGSSGSVVPLFRDQIREGGPVTVTHPDIIRYFMTISEACQLVLQAGSMGQGGEVFVLDMGEPVKIVDLARKMIHLMGLTEKTEERPDGDIEIRFTGLRPGEKLYEELLIGDAPQGTSHPRIMMAREASMPWPEVESLLKKLSHASQTFDCERIVKLIREAPTGYAPNGDVADVVWCNSCDPVIPLQAEAEIRKLGA